MAYYYSKSEDVEMIIATSNELNYDYVSSKDLLKREIEKKQDTLDDAKRALAYFEKHFNRTFYVNHCEQKEV